MIDGENKEIEFNFMKALDFMVIDELNFYLGVSENSFKWLTPLEEIRSGFIYNLEFNGSKIGQLIENELSRLPQREQFLIYKIGTNFKNNINFNNYFSFFYNIDFVYLINNNYQELNSFPSSNVKFQSGLKFFYKDFEANIYGTIYKNNIIGYEDISFNQRSEHHFNNKFGNIGLSLKYSF